MSDPLELYERDYIKTLKMICRAIGYGRVMQVASEAWREVDPIGAISLGPCYGSLKKSALASLVPQPQAQLIIEHVEQSLERYSAEAFETWWTREGMFLDPDSEDVPWFDKRKELCAFAFHAATAQSCNYVADREVEPTEVTFTNGRRVRLASLVPPRGEEEKP